MNFLSRLSPIVGSVGANYNLVILTTYRNPPSAEAHKKIDLTQDNLGYDPDTHTYSLVIDASNADQFGPANAATTGNFPGWQMGNMYRLYIEYYDSTNVETRTQLNNGGKELMQYFTTPMQLASPPAYSVERINSLISFIENKIWILTELALQIGILKISDYYYTSAPHVATQRSVCNFE